MKITLERDEIISILEAHINQILASEPTAPMKVQYDYEVPRTIAFEEEDTIVDEPDYSAIKEEYEDFEDEK